MKFKVLPEIHPILFSAAPALLLISNNPGQAFLSDAISPIGATLLGISFLWILLSFFLKDRRKVALITSGFIFLFFSFGHFQGFLRYYFDSPLLGEIVRPRYLLLICLALFALSSYLIIKTHKNLGPCTTFLNFMSLALIVLPLVQIISFSLQANLSNNRSSDIGLKAKTSNFSRSQKVFPDIYYIILDAYARESTLKEHLEYNNHDFINYLEEKGFYVASKSRSNYASTPLSLSSALNMEYINYLSEIAGSDTATPYFAWNLVVDNKVMGFLKNMGYKVINFSSMYHPTRHLKIADINVHCTHSKQFNSVFLQTTMYHSFEEYLHWVTDYRKHHLCTFLKIPEYGALQGPKFIFAHMLIPHDPYVFGPDGEEISQEETDDNEIMKQRYLGQLTFLNKKVRGLVEQILPKSPPFPIIVLQSDHGANAGIIPDEIYVRERMKNFTAYYLPGQGKELLYETITPVNTFRLIFDHYFKEKYDLLPDHSFYSTYTNYYDFKKVEPGENVEFHGYKHKK